MIDVELGVLFATIMVYVDSKLLLEFGMKLPVFYESFCSWRARASAPPPVYIILLVLSGLVSIIEDVVSFPAFLLLSLITSFVNLLIMSGITYCLVVFLFKLLSLKAELG